MQAASAPRELGDLSFGVSSEHFCCFPLFLASGADYFRPSSGYLQSITVPVVGLQFSSRFKGLRQSLACALVFNEFSAMKIRALVLLFYLLGSLRGNTGGLMKLNSNLFLTAALAATVTAMVACAPAKRGAKFADRTGSNANATEAEKVSGVRQQQSVEAENFRDQIISISAEVEEANEDEESEEAIDKLLAEYVASGESSLEPIKEEEENQGQEESRSKDNSTQGLASNQPVSNVRSKYIMNVRVNLANVGHLDLVAGSTKFGNAKMLRTLTHVNKECSAKYADLKIKAICADKSCNKLLVQFLSGARGSATDLHVEEVLTKKEVKNVETKHGEVKLLTFSEIDRTQELADRGVQVQTTMADCKSKEQEAKKKTEEESAEETLAGLPE